MIIGVDLMGCDCSPVELFEAILQHCLNDDFTATFDVLATPPMIDQIRQTFHADLERLPHNKVSFTEVSEVIGMDEDPVKATHEKSDASVVVGMKALNTGKINALVSAGSTGALLVCSIFYLSLLKQVKRPALLVSLPTKAGNVVLLDVGANTVSNAAHLLQFAIMGAAYQKCIAGIVNPTVGLLNMGGEAIKGSFEHKRAYALLKDYVSKGEASLGFRFFGNVEGRDIFKGHVDVIVTDGFSGNILLKGLEGTIDFILEDLQANFPEESTSNVVQRLKTKFHYAEFPGAVLCGINGVVVKCHGDASKISLFNGIRGAVDLLKNDFVHKLSFAVEKQES